MIAKFLKSKILNIWLKIAVFFLPFLALIPSAFAQGKSGAELSKPLVMMFALSLVAVVPILLVMMTSFIKITVVLSLIRSAMGTQQIPPNQVITGLAVILTIYIMFPVGLEVYRNAESTINQTSSQGVFSQATVGLLKEGVKKGQEPIRAFLVKHATEKERVLFFNLAKKMQKPEDRDLIQDSDFLILVPSFIVSELAKAFQIGFIIFLPFLVIDMVVANILLSLGMFQLSPITVSLPFKLLLFVLVDGWYLITKGLIMGYV